MDAFNLLGIGIRFKNKRTLDEHEIFKLEHSKSHPSKINVHEHIDFFNRELDDTRANNLDLDVHDIASPPSPNTNPAKVQKNAHSISKRNVTTTADESPRACTSFEDMVSMGLITRRMFNSLKSFGYVMPTPIQNRAISAIYEKRDIIACAPTGSGKTLAYLLPIIGRYTEPHVPHDSTRGKALILLPSRELASQVYREALNYSGKTCKVVMLTKSNLKHPEKRFDILISTPLRLIHAIKLGNVDFSSLNLIVVDEADRLFESEFIEQVDEIFDACQQSSFQKAMFSATLSSSVEILARSIMSDPLQITVGQKNTASDTIEHSLVYAGNDEGKLLALRQHIQQGLKPPVLIFVNSIERAKNLFRELIYNDVNVDLIHSERTLSQRDCIIRNFRAGKIWVLIATDIIGRGLDFKGINLVINYDFPHTTSSYIHRVGRCGRAGRTGKAVTFFTKEDGTSLFKIARAIKASGGEIPEWILNKSIPLKTSVTDKKSTL